MPNDTTKPKRGRPVGSKQPEGHRAGRRALPKGDAYAARLTSWRTWWPTRPRSLTLAVAAERLEKTVFTLTRWAAAYEPPEAELGNLECLCAAYGYEPPTSDYLFL